MAQRKVISTQQASFLESLILRIEDEATATAAPDTRLLAHEENPQPSIISPAPDEMANLLSFISALAQTPLDATSLRTPYQERDYIVAEERSVQSGTESEENLDSTTREGEPDVSHSKQEEHQPSFLPISPQWLLDHHPDLLVRIAATWNAMRACERLPSFENAEHVLAQQLVYPLSGSHTEGDAEAVLLDCCRDLEKLAQRLYGDVTDQTEQEISRYVSAFVENALRQPYEEKEAWIRQALEAAVRKVLAGQSDRIYSALVVSTLQRPFREIVRRSLEANEIPFPERVLAQAREKGYTNTMRESLQTLARLGLTAQSATLAWQAARSGQTASMPPWIARRADGCAAAILEGYAVVEQRVICYPGYALLATFDAEQRVTSQMTITISVLQQAKPSLWAQGYRRDAEGFLLPARVVQLWCDCCRGRDNGWWFGDQAGRVMVVIPYVMRSRLRYHKPLCRAVEQMQVWGYRFRYDDHALYFLPASVDLPSGTPIPTKEDNRDMPT